MTYLVDANVLSEPTKSSPDPSVVEWLRHNEREIVVDPVILGEVRFGILLLPKGKRRTGLRWAKLLAELRGDPANRCQSRTV